MPRKIGPEAITHEIGDPVFEVVIAPVMNQLAREAKQELLGRLEQIKAVPTAAERDAVRALQQRIKKGMEKISEGADPQQFCGELVGVVSERAGPTPFLGRVLAVQAIGGLLAEEKRVSLDPNTRSGEELRKAMATEPVLRGGPILQGVLEGSIRAAKHSELLPPARWKVPWDPDINNKEKLDQWKREAMIAEAADLFACNPQLLMTLPEWRVVKGVMSLEPGSHPEGHMVPKYVVRLKALSRGVDRKSEGPKEELRCHICSSVMQLVAAAYGMPRSNRFEAADLVSRNPTAVLAGSRLALDEAKGEQALRIQGLGVDALYVMDDGQKGKLEEEINRLGGDLPFKFARELLPPDGLTWVVAARALRKVRSLDQATQRKRIRSAVEAVIRELNAPAEIQVFERGELASSKQTSIMAAYTGQFNRERGSLERRAVTEVEATDSLRAAAIGLLSSVTPDGIPVVRAESDIIRLMPEVVRRGISSEDLDRFSSLGKSADVRIETIHRESTPKGARPPITVVRG